MNYLKTKEDRGVLIVMLCLSQSHDLSDSIQRLWGKLQCVCTYCCMYTIGMYNFMTVRLEL